MNVTRNRYMLCVPCAERMKHSFNLRILGRSVNQKINCENCGRRRFGAEYEVEKKPEESDAMEKIVEAILERDDEPEAVAAALGVEYEEEEP